MSRMDRSGLLEALCCQPATEPDILGIDMFFGLFPASSPCVNDEGRETWPGEGQQRAELFAEPGVGVKVTPPWSQPSLVGSRATGQRLEVRSGHLLSTAFTATPSEVSSDTQENGLDKFTALLSFDISRLQLVQ